MKNTLAFLALCLLISGCQMTVATKTAHLPDGVIASAVLKNARNSKVHSFIYGTLLIENNSKEIERVNLNCFYLENDQLSS